MPPTSTWALPWPPTDRSTRPPLITAGSWNSSPVTRRPTTTWALILANHGKIEEAIAHFRKALETRPDYLEAHYNLAMVLAGHGKPGEALAHYEKALTLATDRNDKALVNLIRARMSRMN